MITRCQPILIATAVLASFATWTPVHADGLKLERVMLSMGGVGYFEWQAEVDGDQALKLTVPYDQVDDILKSLVVFDDKGRVGGVELPGRKPGSQLFHDLPFNRGALQSAAKLLNALQGVDVTVTGSRALSGRILKAETETYDSGDHGTASHTRVTLLTANGLQQFILEDVEALKFNDPKLEAEVTKALTVIAQSHARDSRTLDITMHGKGRRKVSVAYVVTAPLWKTAYRLTLPASPKATNAHMQGWAVLENMSGQDWKNVDLTLVSGHPVTFRQALYESYYVDRPSVPVSVIDHILPEPDHGASNYIARKVAVPQRAMAVMAPSSAALANTPPVGESASGTLTPPPEQAHPAIPTSTTETQTQVIFRLKSPVSVVSGHSLSVPIIDRDIPATKVDLFSPETAPDNPLAALDLDNDGATGLPPGILTLYEKTAHGIAYVGDARLGTLPAGDKRLVSYALDQKIRIDRNDRSNDILRSGRIAHGVLRLTTTRRHIATFKISSAPKAHRKLILEVPKLANYTVVEPTSGIEETPRTWRLVTMIEAGKTRTVQLVAELPVNQKVALTSINDNRLAYYASASALDGTTKTKLAKLAQLKRTAVERHQTVKDKDGTRAVIEAEQGRLRANLKAVPKDSDLYRRYLKKLDEEETALEKVQTERASAQKQATTADHALADFIASS